MVELTNATHESPGIRARLSEADLADLREAKRRLESPSLTAKIADTVGRPIERGFKLLPKNWSAKVNDATETALVHGLDFAVQTMGAPEPRKARNWLHKLVIASSGAAAGAVGPYSLIVELPFSTAVILRSIADIARSQGHDISLIQVKLACLEVLALGSKRGSVDAVETGYWAVRGALARSISDAASHLAEKGLTERGAPPLARLIVAIASRFSTVVTEEAAAKAIPVIGAVSGGAINYLFMAHFQDLAWAHFVVKRLENTYGSELVKSIYRELVI
jgi:hypothetical protein